MAWADRYVRIPRFVDQGRDFDGVDCWGLVWLVWKHERDRELPSYLQDYEHSEQREPLGRLISSECGSAYWRKVTPQPFAVAVFNIPDMKTRKWHPCHVGIIVDSTVGSFIHARKRMVVEAERYIQNGLYGSTWAPRFMGAYLPR